jgi:hypothetical protein
MLYHNIYKAYGLQRIGPQLPQVNDTDSLLPSPYRDSVGQRVC